MLNHVKSKGRGKAGAAWAARERTGPRRPTPSYVDWRTVQTIPPSGGRPDRNIRVEWGS